MNRITNPFSRDEYPDLTHTICNVVNRGEGQPPLDEEVLSSTMVFGGIVAATAATIIGPMIASLYRSGKDALARRAGKEWDSQSDSWMDIRDWQAKELARHKASWDKLFRTAFAGLETMSAQQKNDLKGFQRRFDDLLVKISRVKTTATGPLARGGHTEFKAIENALKDLQSDIRYWGVKHDFILGSSGKSSSDWSLPSGGDGISSS